MAPTEPLASAPVASAEPPELADARRRAEEIAARDLNNLYLTSRFFRDPEKYRAFCAFYAVMRVVDDRVDALPARSRMTDAERREEHRVIGQWRLAVERLLAGAGTAAAIADPTAVSPVQRDLLIAFAEAGRRFPTPERLWANFFRAMDHDVERPRFATYSEFLDYAEGATVAPTTIYLFLIAARPGAAGGERYQVADPAELVACGRDLGVFAYLTHIIRDLADDLRAAGDGLIYFARQDLERHGLAEADLFADLARGQASRGVIELVGDYARRAERLLASGRRRVAALQAALTPDCRFILELIISIYERALAKIVEVGCDPFAERHRLSAAEKTAVVEGVAERLGYSPRPVG